MDAGERIAKLISVILSNPIVNGLFGFVMTIQEAIQRWGSPNLLAALLAAIIYGVMPFLGALMLFLKKKSDLFVSKRELRPKLFGFALISYIIGFLLFWNMGLVWIASFSLMMFLGTVIYMFITFKWKISIHVSGLVVPLTVLSFRNGIFMLIGLILVPLLMWARVRLGAHTWPQVIIGAIMSWGFAYLGSITMIPTLEELTYS